MGAWVSVTSLRHDRKREAGARISHALARPVIGMPHTRLSVEETARPAVTPFHTGHPDASGRPYYTDRRKCPQCGDRLFTPEWSDHVTPHCVRHLWSCDSCGYQFATSVM